jgi:hypothetical protein
VFFMFLLGFAFDPFWFRVLVESGFGQSAAAGGRSAGAWRIVRVLPADGPLFRVVSGGSGRYFGRSAVQGRQSAVWVRTVHGSRQDGPRGSSGQSAPPGRTVRPRLTACFLVRFLPSFLVLLRVLQGIVPKTRG